MPKQRENEMKKIMFNDKYGLTQAVLEGRKTQTRRIITHPKRFKGKDVCGFYVYKRAIDGVITEICMYDEDEISIDEGQILPKYKPGEIVAVAQSYRDCGGRNEEGVPRWDIISKSVGATNSGWDNKMFVRADLMPHHIRITDVRVERLQGISDEDCLKEGIAGFHAYSTASGKAYTFHGINESYKTPQKAYASLIDRISGKGTWESNPFVWVYEFELID